MLKEGARLSKQSEQNLNTLLNGSTELDDVARALNMLDVESLEGIIKAAVKSVAHSFMEAGRFSGDQQCEEEKEEPDEQSGEDEEHCPPLDETMAASWIAQIGEEGLSETEAVDSFIAVNEQRKRTQEGSTKGSRTTVRNRANGSRQLRQSTRQSSTSMDGDGTPKDLRARLRKENMRFRCKKNGVAVGSAKPPSAPCGGTFDASPSAAVRASDRRGFAGGFALGTCMLSRVMSSCWSLRSSSAASGYGGSLWRDRRWRWCGNQFGFSGNLEKLYKPLRFLGTFSRGRVLLGGHPLWRSATTGAGSAALGRHSLAHGCGDCWWCHDEAH